jgi:aldose 1-epimerase
MNAKLPADAGPGISRREFGHLPDGRLVEEFTLHNGRGMSLSAINLGGIVTSLRVPDRHGRVDNVVLGFDNLQAYVERNPNFGTIVGRFANRIAAGRFAIDGQVCQLELNDGPNALHGGPRGFGKRWWRISPVSEAATPHDAGVALDLSCVDEHGAGGYPGRLAVTVRYTLTPRNEWCIDYRASTDRSTVVNLSSHSYFNLLGQGSALDHWVTLTASRFTAIDEHLIPTAISDVANTPFDFRQRTRIAERIRQGVPQLALARGFDHNFVLDPDTNANAGAALRFAARLEDDVSGRVMDIETTEPAIQFYSGNFLDGSLVGSAGQIYRQGDGLCFETQHYPDSPNHPEFPSTLLRPGELFSSRTVHRFTTQAPN